MTPGVQVVLDIWLFINHSKLWWCKRETYDQSLYICDCCSILEAWSKFGCLTTSIYYQDPRMTCGNFLRVIFFIVYFYFLISSVYSLGVLSCLFSLFSHFMSFCFFQGIHPPFSCYVFLSTYCSKPIFTNTLVRAGQISH